MKRPDAVSLIAVYHFVMSIPFLIGSGALVLAVVPVLINVESREVVWPLFGIGIGLFFCLLSSCWLALGFGGCGRGPAGQPLCWLSFYCLPSLSGRASAR